MSIILDVTKQRLVIPDSRVMGEPYFWEGVVWIFCYRYKKLTFEL